MSTRNVKYRKLVHHDATVGDIDEYTKVLLHFDESATKDECGNTWTAFPNTSSDKPTLKTTYYKFGGKSLYLSYQKNQYITTGGKEALDMSNYDWTFDFWIRCSTSNDKPIFQTGTGTAFHITIRDSSVRIGNFVPTEQTIFNYTLPLSDWHHVAIVKSSSEIFLFVDGAKQVSDVAAAYRPTGSYFTIGKGYSNSLSQATANYFAGYLDEFRFSYGIARWTEDFTPPTEPYRVLTTEEISQSLQGDDGTNYTTPIALLHFNDPQRPACDEVLENQWKIVGSPAITTEQAKFGGKALKITGNIWKNQFYCEDISLSNSDFTVDFWIYIPTGSSGKIQTHSYEYVCNSTYGYGTDVSANFIWNSSQIYFETGSGTIYFENFQRDIWNHVAIVFAKNTKTYYCYLNGQLVGNYQISDFVLVTGEPLTRYTIPVTGGVSNVVIAGECYIDEFRITPEALWNDDFTPPTAQMNPETVDIANANASDIFIHTADEVLAITKSKKTPTLTVSTDSITLNELGDTVRVTMDTNSDGEFNVWTNNTDLVSIDRFGNQFTVEQIREGSGVALVFVQVLEGREYEASEAVSINVGAYQWGALWEHTPEEIQMACRLGIAHNLWSVGDYTKNIPISKFKVGGYIKTIHTGDLSYREYHDYYIQADESKNEPLMATLIGINHNKNLETPDVTGDVLHFALARKPSGGYGIALTETNYNKQIIYSEYKYLDKPWSILHHRNVTKNEGGWSKSIIRSKFLPTLKEHLPIEWQRVIRPIWKYTDNRTDHTTDVMTEHNGVSFVVDKSGITKTYDYLFLPSEYEVFGEITQSHPGEAYFQEKYTANMGVGSSRLKYTVDSSKVADINAGKYDCTWWLRSPRLADKTRFCRVNTAGESGYKLANYSSGIVPCFVIY